MQLLEGETDRTEEKPANSWTFTHYRHPISTYIELYLLLKLYALVISKSDTGCPFLHKIAILSYIRLAYRLVCIK